MIFYQLFLKVFNSENNDKMFLKLMIFGYLNLNSFRLLEQEV